jgi:acyl carrier protein
MDDEIETTLAKYIAEKILKQPKRVIGPEDRLISSGLIDSFHLVDLALFVEETFRVRMDDTELNAQTFDTLAALAAIIRARQTPQ